MDSLTSSRPLHGIRVLDVSRVLAGPYCATMLADAGADVVKIERPGAGDESRRYGALRDGVGLDFLNVNRGKRGLALDLKSASGPAVFRRLANAADVVIENFVPGTMERFGIGYQRLSDENPRLVYCSISAYGERGELANRPGYDAVLQAFSGHMGLTGEIDGGPVRTGASVIDMSTGIAAYGAITTALLQRFATGKGQHLSLSLMHTALSLLGTHGSVVLNTDKEPRRAGSGVSHLAPYRAYPTATDYIVVGALNEVSWSKLCSAIGAPELATDGRYCTMQQRLAHREELDSALEARFRTAPASEWLRNLSGQGLVVSKVNTIRDALDHPQTVANLYVQETADQSTDSPPLRYVRSPVTSDAYDNRSLFGPPKLGEHSLDILEEAGLNGDEIRELIDGGAIGH